MILPRDLVHRELLPLSPRASTPSTTHIGSEFGLTPTTPPHARFGPLGIFYLSFAGAWTLLLSLVMIYLYRKRRSPTLRIRGLPLSFAGIILLHLYWATVQSGYVIGPLAPEVAEYWIMGIWYPFGIALFQAGNSQFLWVARGQGRWLKEGGEEEKGVMGMREREEVKKKGWWGRMDYSQKMFLCVTAGMGVQLFVVVLVYMISKKFHPSFGIPGTEVYGNTPMEIAIQQGRGWEWWPSLFWQFLWAWIVAPIILWRSRGIKDTHGWQLQTIACCIAGLPAAPMWLIALYVPAMGPVNAVLIPPQWIAISIFIIEIFTILLPCYQVHKHQALRQETLDCITSWESSKKISSSTASTYLTPGPVSPTSTKFSLSPSLSKTTKPFDFEAQPEPLPTDGVLTMAALEHVLSRNPSPLLHFSATRDFSGENIAFLSAVSNWRASLPTPFLRNRYNSSPEAVRQVFTEALRIYTEFVSTREADFPINIGWADLKKLQSVFDFAASIVRDGGGEKKRRDSALAFGEVDYTRDRDQDTESQIGITKAERPGTEGSVETLVLEGVKAGGKEEEEEGLWQGEIPVGFDATVFDAAESSIKYLVLTNTWPKYVRERRSSEGSVRTAETDETARLKGSLRRAFAFLGPLVRRSST